MDNGAREGAVVQYVLEGFWFAFAEEAVAKVAYPFSLAPFGAGVGYVVGVAAVA